MDQLITILTLFFAILFVVVGFFVLRSNPHTDNTKDEITKNETDNFPPKKNSSVSKKAPEIEKAPENEETKLTKEEEKKLKQLANDIFFLFPLYEEGEIVEGKETKRWVHPAFPHIIGEISGVLFKENHTDYGGKEAIFGNSPDTGITLLTLLKEKKSTQNVDLGKSSWSISIWFKTRNHAGQRMIGRGHDYWTPGFFLGMGEFQGTPTPVSAGISAGDKDSNRNKNTYFATIKSGYNDDLWHNMVVLHHAGKYLAIYVDGKPEQIQKYWSTAGTVQNNQLDIEGLDLPLTSDRKNHPIVIGNTSLDSEGFDKYQTWKGSLRDLVCWKDRVLTAEEISFLYRFGEIRNVGNAITPYLTTK